MAQIIAPNSAPLDEYNWDQFSYNVQPIDLHQMLWNLIGYVSYLMGDVYNSANGIVSGLAVSSGTGMAFNIATGRGRGLNGLKVVQLTTPNTQGQPASFNTGTQVANGSGLSAGQTRVDSICLQISQATYQDANGADHIIDTTAIVVVPGTPGAPGAPPAIPGSDYLLLADVTIHQGDTASSQATVSLARVINFASIPSLTNSLNALNAVILNPGSPQAGSASINGSLSLGTFVDQPAIVTPASPASGHYREYYKSDGNKYVYDPVYGEQLAIPIGVPTPWLSGTLPAGCFWIDGSVFSTVSYPRLGGITNGQYKIGAEVLTNQDRLPDFRFQSPIGQDNFGQGAAGRAGALNLGGVGARGGASSHTGSLAELVAHGHTDSGHNHIFNDPGHIHIHNVHTHTEAGHTHTQSPHGHTYADSGHIHAINDPGHYHWISRGFGSGPITGGADSDGLTHPGSTPLDTEVTGIQIVLGLSNISINSTTAVNSTGFASINNTTTTENSATTGGSNTSSNAVITSTGSSTPYSVMNPYQCIYGWIIRY